MNKATKARVWAIGGGIMILTAFLAWILSIEIEDQLDTVESVEGDQAELPPFPDASPSLINEPEIPSSESSQANQVGNAGNGISSTIEGAGSSGNGARGKIQAQEDVVSRPEVEPEPSSATLDSLQPVESPLKESDGNPPLLTLARSPLESKFSLDAQSLANEKPSSPNTYPTPLVGSHPAPDTLTRARAAGVLPSIDKFRHGSSRNIVCKEGTLLKIPGNCFEHLDGTPLHPDAPVQIHVKEFYDLYDILMTGLTTHGPDGVLETGGMIHLSASSLRKPLKLVSGKAIQLVFSSDPKKTAGMQLYHGVEQENAVDWVKAGRPSPTERIIVDTPIKSTPASLVLMDGSLSGERLEATVKSNRKLDFDKGKNGNGTFSGTGHVWGSLTNKRIGGTVLFSNGVWMMKFPDRSTPESSLRLKAFHQAATPPHAKEWFESKQEVNPSRLSLESPSSSHAFVFTTPPLRPESNVEVRFPWGSVKSAQNAKQTAFFVKHKTGQRGSFTTHFGCLQGLAEISGQTGKGRKKHHIKAGEVLVLGRQPGKLTYSGPKKTLDSDFEGWQYGSKAYPDWHRKVTLDKVIDPLSVSSLTSYAVRSRSMDDYYRSVREEPMRRIERQFSVTKLGWTNLDKPGQRDAAATVHVEATRPVSSDDASAPIVRAVYAGSSSCVLIDGKRFVPSGKALLVAVAYHPITLAPTLDYRPVTFRPGDNQYKLTLGSKSPDDFRQVVNNWKNTQ